MAPKGKDAMNSAKRALRPSSTPSSHVATVPQSVPPSRGARGTRATDQYVFFWGGPLSNWNVGKPFSGERCFEFLLPRLHALEIKHPSASALSTRLLSAHNFVCGEQWMMAVKGWLFERDIEMSEKDTTLFDQDQLTPLYNRLYSKTPPSDPAERAMWDSTICKCLRTTSPRNHKSFGRHAHGYVDQTWNKASFAVVVSCSVARAEQDNELQKIYLEEKYSKLSFVEGSPCDKIWGVGLAWDDKRIDKKSNWRGENRLGMCHDEARKIFQELL